MPRKGKLDRLPAKECRYFEHLVTKEEKLSSKLGYQQSFPLNQKPPPARTIDPSINCLEFFDLLHINLYPTFIFFLLPKQFFTPSFLNVPGHFHCFQARYFLIPLLNELLAIYAPKEHAGNRNY